MKMNQLRDFLAVARWGSLRAASRHLGVAQPAITRSIRDLEQELSVALFDRHAKGISLTAPGRAFVLRVEVLESDLRRAREEVLQLAGHSTGEVSAAFSTATSIALLPHAVSGFQKRFPDGILKIQEGLFQAYEAEIANGSIDFWVGPLEESSASSHFSVEKLFENQRYVLLRKGHPLSSARSLAELAGARWIRPALSSRFTEGDFLAAFERLGLPAPKIVMHTPSAFITVLVVANSDLLTILPQQWTKLSFAADLFQTLDINEPSVMRASTICIVRRTGLSLTPMAEYLCDLVRRAAVSYVNENVAA
jgi:LysR family transcriptional regulator, regulator of abg operon